MSKALVTAATLFNDDYDDDYDDEPPVYGYTCATIVVFMSMAACVAHVLPDVITTLFGDCCSTDGCVKIKHNLETIQFNSKIMKTCIIASLSMGIILCFNIKKYFPSMYGLAKFISFCVFIAILNFGIIYIPIGLKNQCNNVSFIIVSFLIRDAFTLILWNMTMDFILDSYCYEIKFSFVELLYLGIVIPLMNICIYYTSSNEYNIITSEVNKYIALTIILYLFEFSLIFVMCYNKATNLYLPQYICDAFCIIEIWLFLRLQLFITHY